MGALMQSEKVKLSVILDIKFYKITLLQKLLYILEWMTKGAFIHIFMLLRNFLTPLPPPEFIF